MSDVNSGPDPHVVALLDAAFRGVRRALEERGVFSVPGLRPSHLRLLSFVPERGIRLTELAGAAGMTKQALGEFVATLEQAGYLTTAVDPRDRRARLARLTAAGQHLRDTTDAGIRAAETDWRNSLGEPRWATLRDLLTALAAPDRPPAGAVRKGVSGTLRT